MKKRITRKLLQFSLISILSLVSVFPCPASAPGTTYDADWPVIHLGGTFTLNVGSGFGNFFSTSALGTYGGLSGAYDTVWTSVKFAAQPNFAELTFIWDQGYTGYAVTPAYVGRQSPWSSANDAWLDLIAKGTADGVYLTAVPEPTAAGLFCAGFPVLMLARYRCWRRRFIG